MTRVTLLALGLVLVMVGLVTVGSSGRVPAAQAADDIDADALVECINGLSTDGKPGNVLKCTLVVTDVRTQVPGIDLLNLQDCLNAISGLAPGNVLKYTLVVTDPAAAVDSLAGTALQECLNRLSELDTGDLRPVPSSWANDLCSPSRIIRFFLGQGPPPSPEGE